MHVSSTFRTSEKLDLTATPPVFSSDFNDPLLTKYKDKFDLDQFIVGAKEAFLALNAALGSQDFYDYVKKYGRLFDGEYLFTHHCFTCVGILTAVRIMIYSKTYAIRNCTISFAKELHSCLDWIRWM
jgi:hypothetical protein